MKIGQVAQMLGLSTETLKRWERSRLVSKPKTDGKGWRVYAEADVERLRAVLKRLHGSGRGM